MICPYDGAECTGNCLYQCPPKRAQARPRASLRAEALVAALMVMLLLTAVLAVVAYGAEVKAVGAQHGYNCPAFPDSRCPEVVNVSARGLWPPDDAPRASWAFMALVFSACTIGAYDVPPSPISRGPVHWLRGRCEW